jgi:chromosome partitioning protein
VSNLAVVQRPQTKAAKVLAIFGPKGGIGKSTTTAHLLVSAVSAGLKAIAVDCDPQRSLMDTWFLERQKHPLAPQLTQVEVIAANVKDYERVLAEYDYYDLIIFDMAPSIDGHELVVPRFLERVDYSIMPCQPSATDWKILVPWMSQLNTWNVNAAFLLSKTKKTRLNLQAKQILSNFDLLPVEIPDYTDIPTQMGAGLTVAEISDAKGSEEYEVLWNQVRRKLGV